MKVFMEILVDSSRLDNSFKFDLLLSLPVKIIFCNSKKKKSAKI
jgi:hypothetical protein